MGRIIFVQADSSSIRKESRSGCMFWEDNIRIFGARQPKFQHCDVETIRNPGTACCWHVPWCCTLTMQPVNWAGFNLEQQALIDLHVLVEAQEFVGHPWSTFACYVRELRAMQGARRTTFLPIMGQLDRRYFFAPEGVLDMLDSAN